jgi:uncharacterized protein (DUF302 family)
VLCSSSRGNLLTGLSSYCKKLGGLMNYYFSKILNTDFDNAISKVTDSLKEEGFGVLTEIDVQQTLKKKINVDFKKYKILGACNPHFAYKALTKEDKIGTMLPCNIVVIEQGENKIEVAAVDPVASMEGIKNSSLESVAGDVRNKLQRVVDRLA